MKIAVLLIALGFGYKIFTDANKEQGGTKSLGRLIGIVMMIASASIGAMIVGLCAKSSFCPSFSACESRPSGCPMMK